MLLAAIVLLAMCLCFFVASLLKRRYDPQPGSALYITMRIGYFVGWAFVIILGIFAIAGIRSLLAFYRP